jgi:hypothetical protein
VAVTAAAIAAAVAVTAAAGNQALSPNKKKRLSCNALRDSLFFAAAMSFLLKSSRKTLPSHDCFYAEIFRQHESDRPATGGFTK